jgi:hypothetical protein
MWPRNTVEGVSKEAPPPVSLLPSTSPTSNGNRREQHTNLSDVRTAAPHAWLRLTLTTVICAQTTTTEPRHHDAGNGLDPCRLVELYLTGA